MSICNNKYCRSFYDKSSISMKNDITLIRYKTNSRTFQNSLAKSSRLKLYYKFGIQLKKRKAIKHGKSNISLSSFFTSLSEEGLVYD